LPDVPSYQGKTHDELLKILTAKDVEINEKDVKIDLLEEANQQLAEILVSQEIEI
jgi:hypothetical protein